ncbi:uncharacterized protein B0I36DRAFT_368331 [Microdochium trichocladiopsis]|uniref:Initiation-specific alpha-1,6-mannosyltransferase n=1 Tax=Microdochium trichocladiopsis TaxID=1682393 RepID=A0A9P9BMZ3_9PEZI|nr:uncharacterized protein B0I36DRAFT_368331 [Microdochium trichocladiopsis]KAH7018302.1 hypothetical protein B0I36DRAFT_368331 [Microdochium trichocladiopsis]
MFSHIINPEELKETPSWLALNPDYSYKLVGLSGADEVLSRYYSDRSEIASTFHKLRNTGIKSDLLRYMLLFNEGGVYTDIDTIALKPIDKWVPQDHRDRIRMLIGIEFDQGEGTGWVDIPHELQFCQWTIAAAPGHRLLAKMLDHGIRRLGEVVRENNSTLEDLKPSSLDVLTSTGPAAWTDVVFAELRQIEPELKTLRDLSGMTGPRVFGDIMILPIDGFGVGQPHSKSTNDGTIPEAALAKHLFRGSWRHATTPKIKEEDKGADKKAENGNDKKSEDASIGHETAQATPSQEANNNNNNQNTTETTQRKDDTTQRRRSGEGMR